VTLLFTDMEGSTKSSHRLGQAAYGVRSRRDLVATIFFHNYEPGVRNNERWATDGRPLRGGPIRAPIANERAEVRELRIGADQ